MPVTIAGKKRSYAGYLGTLGTTVAAPNNTTAPVVQGVPEVGRGVVASPGLWENLPAPVITYQWQLNGSAVVGEINQRYIVQSGDEGKTLTVDVTATNSEGNNTVSSAGVVVYMAPDNTAVPVITGTAKVGETLTGSNGTWDGEPTPTFTYQWLVDGVDIDGATNATYEIDAADEGEVIAFTVTATNVMGEDSATSAPTAAVESP